MQPPLTKRQHQILQAFQSLQAEVGYSPTLRELGEELGVNRVTVYGHIQVLLEKGALENLFPGASRGLDITEFGNSILGAVSDSENRATAGVDNNFGSRPLAKRKLSQLAKTSQPLTKLSQSPRSAPCLGKIAAGGPILAQENQRSVDIPELLNLNQQSYLLQVSGDSMIGAQIAHGDWVIVRSDRQPEAKDIVVAILTNGPQEECTLKTYIPLGNGRIKLQPENNDYEATIVRADELEIRGVVSGLLRNLQS